MPNIPVTSNHLQDLKELSFHSVAKGQTLFRSEPVTVLVADWNYLLYGDRSRYIVLANGIWDRTTIVQPAT